MLLNVCEDRNIKFDIIKTILMQKKSGLILVIYYLLILLEACHIIWLFKLCYFFLLSQF